MRHQVRAILLFPPLILLVGTLGYHFLEDWPWLASLFMTVITVTTVGYSEVRPLTPEGQVFTMVLIFSSFGVMAYCIASITDFFIKGKYKHFLWELYMEQSIAQIRDHYIICGFGRKGQAICDRLADNGIGFIIIEKNAERTSTMRDARYLHIIGNATEDEILEQAQITRAKGLLAILGDDPANTYLVLSARQLNPKIKILAWTHSHQMEKKLYRAGAHKVFSPYILGGNQMVHSILRPRVTDFLDFVMSADNENLRLEQIEIPETSAFSGQSIQSLKIHNDYGVIILGVQRQDANIFIPPAQTVFQAHDTVIALGSKAQLDRLKKAL
ncbi:MAG: potassium channel protein [SAR324 cluster bacterium]|nr:potassium channel protein [SAR324 cluster bacterium]